MYYDVVIQVEPKKKALREAGETLAAANEKLTAVNALVADLESKLAILVADLDKALADKVPIVVFDGRPLKNRHSVQEVGPTHPGFDGRGRRLVL